jgi:hypothetical protein
MGKRAPAMQPPPPKAAFGCLIAALVAGVVGLVLLVVVGAFILRVARVQRELVRRGVTAPGMQQLHALGCDPGSTAMDARQSWPRGDAQPPTETSVFLACLATEGKTVPSCDEVARTYVEAVRPSGNFVAQVRVVRRFRIECQRVYSETGVPLEDVTP